MITKREVSKDVDELICWCEDCEEKFEYDSTTKHDTHEIWKLYRKKNGKKVR